MTRDQILEDLERRNAEITALRDQIAAAKVDLAGLTAERNELAKRIPSTDAEPVLSVIEHIARFVESQPNPVGAKETAEHLTVINVPYTFNSLSTLFSRLVDSHRLTKIGRGRFTSAQD